MREMKDSGIFYIPPYNAEWRLSKIGYECTKLWRSFNPDDTPLLCTNKGKIAIRPDEMLGRMVSEDHAMQGIRKGDIAIHGMDTWHGAIALSDYDGKITRVVHVCDSDNDKRFIVYYLQQLAFNGVYKLISNGIRENTSDFRSWDKVADIYIVLPSVEEQKKISDFLDSKCAEIDALCADIQSELENLETYKRSVISEAVTKGLDKNVPMKDSGIEWIGEIPEHWELKRGKYIFEQKNDKGNNKSLVLLSPTQNYGVIPQEKYEELSGFSAVKLNEKTDYNSLKTVHKGAFVISLRSFQGGFEYSEYEGVVSPAYQVFYPTIQICDGYYKYLFKTQIFIDKMNSYTMSLRDGKNIAFADFGRTYLPIPPLKEQIDIAEYLDKLCNEIKIIVEEKNQQLEILADYRKSVIYEYVTGKKEVPSV